MKDLLNYNPETGLFTWIVDRGRLAKAGDIAGTLHYDGYVQIKIRGKKHAAHRLAWFLHYGEWPPEEVDHINEVKTDNRICNLRLASRSENQRHKGKCRNNKSGYKGVCLYKPTGRWQAQCRVNGKRFYLGYYDTPEEAQAAYCAFAEKNHKEFFHK